VACTSSPLAEASPCRTAVEGFSALRRHHRRTNGSPGLCNRQRCGRNATRRDRDRGLARWHRGDGRRRCRHSCGRFRLALGDRDWTGAAGVRLDPRALGADRGKLAQRRPGTQLRFQTVSLAEAVEARRAQARLLEGPIGLEPLVRTEFSSNFCSASTSLMVSSAPPDETEQLGWPSRSRPASRLSSSPKSSLPVPLAGHTYPAGSTRYAIDL
jgi:hypothetical protein